MTTILYSAKITIQNFWYEFDFWNKKLAKLAILPTSYI